MQKSSIAGLNILLVEDDKELALFLQRGLQDESCIVTVANDGRAGLTQAEQHAYDIILLDVMLPVLDGLQVTRRMRLEKIRTPILLLTARDSPEDIVQGLDAGADDYVPKPFEFDVLLARIRARTRYHAHELSTQLRYADISLDSEKHVALRSGRSLDLTQTEYAILETLLRSAGRVVTRRRIIDSVWGGRDVSENNLDVFIRYLRNKVDTPGRPRLVHTERGLGYSLREGAE